MTRRAFIAALLVLLVGLPGSVHANDPAPVIADMARPAVVTIYTDKGQGSGFIVSPQGYVVTNAHVIEGAGRIRAVMQNGREAQGTVVARGSEDVALIRLNVMNMPTLRLGQGRTAQPGEIAVWFGSPKGLIDTVTRGSIANNQRTINGTKYLQLDGYVNPGNSGGPVLNMRGEVIGIITAKDPGSDGIGYALPIETAYALLRDHQVAVNVSAAINDLAYRIPGGDSVSPAPPNGGSPHTDRPSSSLTGRLFSMVGIVALAGATSYGFYRWGRRKQAKQRLIVEASPDDDVSITLKK